MRLLNGLFGDDQLRSSANNNCLVNGGCRRTTSSSELAVVPQQQQQTTLRTEASINRPQNNRATNQKFLAAKSSSLASFNDNINSAPMLGSANLASNVSNIASSDANQDNDDEQSRALRLVCRRLNLNDSDKVVAAVVIIQRAFRKYQIGKRFRMITEQLRRTCQSSSAQVTGDNRSTTNLNVSYANGTTRAAAWESLSHAASRLAASAAATKQALKQQVDSCDANIANGKVAKSVSSQQVSQSADTTSYREPSRSAQLHQRSASAIPGFVNESKRSIPNCASANATNASQMKSSNPSVVAAALNFQQLESLRKRQYRVGLNIFNKNPEKGVSFLIAHSFIDCSSPLTKSSTSYYLANQLHFIDKQNLAQQQVIQVHQQQSQSADFINQRQVQHHSNCQLCIEEENLKSNVAHFLLHRKGLAKEKIGQYLGNLQCQFNQDVLRYYLRELDFSGLQIDIALRKFSSTLRMPGEAQKIERFVDYFAQRYVQCQQQQQQQQLASNPPANNLSQVVANDNRTPLKLLMRGSNKQQQQNMNGNNKNYLTLLSKDEIFILTFAIIMLNTDLHSPSLKSTSRMSGQQFINNLRGVFKSQTINEIDLLEIYERVKANQITTTPDHVTHVMKVQQGLTVNNFQKKDTIPNLCVPHRRLVCFCRLFEVYDVNKKERVGQHQREVFLFNDMLLVTKLARRTRNNTSQQYTYRQSITLQGLCVQLFQSNHYNFGIRLCQRSNDETLIMFNARNELDQSRFVNDLSESIAEMEEMEVIRAHNIIEKIHVTHQERLRRHAMMHEMQSIGDVHHQFENDKLSRDLTINFDSKKRRAASSEKLIILEDESEKQEVEKTEKPSDADKKSDASTKSKPRRLQSKFSSMSNLSSVSEGHDDEQSNICKENRINDQTKVITKGSLSNGLRLNRSFVQPIKPTNEAAQPLPRPRRRTNEPLLPADRLNRNQRSCSTNSVHSLDSGLFLSRDVSPNQSG